MLGSTAPAGIAPRRSFHLEAHYYSGGLQIQPAIAGEGRPDWAPAPPDRFAGFRDELPLADTATVVEFSRFRLQASHLTWLGVYRRAVDEKFGDRRNHSGVGVWLQDQFITRPGLLLSGLSQLVDLLVEQGVQALGGESSKFAESYVPQYVTDAPLLPAELSGWPFSPTPYGETELYRVEGTDRSAWAVVADHVSKWSVLAPPRPNVSRAVILLSSQAERERTSAEAVTILSATPLSEVVNAFPEAISKIGQGRRTLEDHLQKAGELNTRLNESLGQERATAAALRGKLEELERQVLESDLLRRLSCIDERISGLDAKVGSSLAETRDLTRAVKSSAKPPQVAFAPPMEEPRALRSADYPRGRFDEPPAYAGDFWGEHRNAIVIGAAITFMLFAGGVILFLFLNHGPPEFPSPN